MKALVLAAAAICAVVPARSAVAQTQINPDPYEKPYTGPTPADVPREAAIVQPGMRVQVHSAAFPRYHQIGILRAASADSVSLRRGDDVLAAATREVDAIFVSLGRSSERGALRGLWMGGAAGVLIGPLLGNEGGDEATRSFTSLVRPENLAIGAAIGALIGGAWGREVWRRAASATPEELSRVVREPAVASAVSVAPYAAAPMAGGSGTLAAGLSIRF